MTRAPKNTDTAKDEARVEIQRQFFRFVARNPFSWFARAEELLDSALVLRNASSGYLPRKSAKPYESIRRHNRIDVAFSLLAVAFENVLKGILVGRDASLVTEDGFKNSFPVHFLDELATKCDLMLRPEHVFLLRRLTPYVFWYAHYPAPMKAKHMGVVRLEEKDFDCGVKFLEELLEEHWDQEHGT